MRRGERARWRERGCGPIWTPAPAQCVNNLKQLGLAVMNDESSNGAIPPTGTPAATPPLGDFGMKTRLLPFVEQAALFNSMNMSYNGLAPNGQNDTIVTTQVNAFNCPSDGNTPIQNYTLKNGGGTAQIGYTSYPNNIGTIYRYKGAYDHEAADRPRRVSTPRLPPQE